MDDTVAFIVGNGYPFLFAWVWTEQAGLPVPGEPLLLAAGALAGKGHLRLVTALGVGVGACLLADIIWYEIGRLRGRQILRLLCRLSIEPDSCVRDSQETFLRYGAWSLLVAKFVPGLNTVAQPLAGIIGMRRSRFLLFDVAGAILWVGVYMGLGYVFADQLEIVARHAARLGAWIGVILAAVLAGYLAFKWTRRHRMIRRLRMARITAEELKRKLDAGEDVMVIDLRHALDYEAEPATIPGALHLAPDEIERRYREIPRGRELVLYCT